MRLILLFCIGLPPVLAQPIEEEEDRDPGIKLPLKLQQTPFTLQAPGATIQQPIAPGTSRGLPQLQGPTAPPVALRTHCNGTCMCTGKDCTDKWKINNCKDGTATCSNDPDSGNTLICSCIKKATTE